MASAGFDSYTCKACVHLRLATHNCIIEQTMWRGASLNLLTCLAVRAQGASALAHKLPGNLIEKAFSRSLDLINPLRELERTPSQVHEPC